MALTLFWRCESEAFDGTHDFSAGDTSAAPGGTAVISSAQFKQGANSALYNGPSDFYTLVNSSDICHARIVIPP